MYDIFPISGQIYNKNSSEVFSFKRVLYYKIISKFGINTRLADIVFVIESFFIEYSAFTVYKNRNESHLLQLFVNILADLFLTFAQVAGIVRIFELQIIYRVIRYASVVIFGYFGFG